MMVLQLEDVVMIIIHLQTALSHPHPLLSFLLAGQEGGAAGRFGHANAGHTRFLKRHETNAYIIERFETTQNKKIKK